MTPASDGRPTVPEAIEALDAYRALGGIRELGGAVHIIVDDGNCKQSHADWCVENCDDWNRDWGGGVHLEEDRAIARMLAAMTFTQRRKVYRGGK